MFDILGIKYVTEKEACAMFGYSVEWMSKQRKLNLVPPYIRMSPRGRILYKKDELEKWIAKRISAEE